MSRKSEEVKKGIMINEVSVSSALVCVNEAKERERVAHEIRTPNGEDKKQEGILKASPTPRRKPWPTATISSLPQAPSSTYINPFSKTTFPPDPSKNLAASFTCNYSFFN